MLNYLYYKLYQASLRSSLHDIPEFMAPVFLGGLISANIFVVSGLLAKLEVLPFPYTSSIQAGASAILAIALLMIYYRKQRYEPILNKYGQESKQERIRGNVIVSIYVAISYLSIFALAFYKPGKL